MAGMNKVLAVNNTDKTMRVQASMMLGELYQHATDAAMSVPLGLMPAWAGLTLAGVMSASAHGSGANTTSSVVSVLSVYATRKCAAHLALYHNSSLLLDTVQHFLILFQVVC